MRALPSELLSELSSERLTPAFLYYFEFTTPRYWTDFSEDIYYNGKWWYAKPIRFNDISFSLGQRISNLELTVGNADKTISNIVLSEDIRGKYFEIKAVALDSNINIIESFVLFFGVVDYWDFDQREAHLKLVSHFIKWNLLTPRRFYSATCQWIFKDPNTCKYNGNETWCDYSIDRCDALGNRDNFGGFPWITHLQDKKIWWGRAPKKD